MHEAECSQKFIHGITGPQLSCYSTTTSHFVQKVVPNMKEWLKFSQPLWGVFDHDRIMCSYVYA